MKNGKILITGVSRGIGFELTKRLLADGFQVVGVGRSAPNIDNPNFTFVACDLAKVNERKKIISELKVHEIDCFIHAASTSMKHAPHPMLNYESLKDTLEVSIHSALEMTNVVGKFMRKQRFGRIILLGSTIQLTGSNGQTDYQTAKSAQEGLLKSLCSELADYGITVNQILLGPALTPGLIEKTTEVQRKELMGRIPGNTFVEYDQIYELMKYIISRSSSPLNGAMIPFAFGAQWTQKK